MAATLAIALVLLCSHGSSDEHESRAGTLRHRGNYSVARTGFHLLKQESNHENSMLLWGFKAVVHTRLGIAGPGLIGADVFVARRNSRRGSFGRMSSTGMGLVAPEPEGSPHPSPLKSGGWPGLA